MKSTTAGRTLKYLREKMGYHAAVVERPIPHTFKKNDFFGFADILAFLPVPGAWISGGGWASPVLAVQCTTASNVSKHFDRVRDNRVLKDWLACGHLFEIWGWAKRGPVRKRKVWTVSRRAVLCGVMTGKLSLL